MISESVRFVRTLEVHSQTSQGHINVHTLTFLDSTPPAGTELSQPERRADGKLGPAAARGEVLGHRSGEKGFVKKTITREQGLHMCREPKKASLLQEMWKMGHTESH